MDPGSVRDTPRLVVRIKYILLRFLSDQVPPCPANSTTHRIVPLCGCSEASFPDGLMWIRNLQLLLIAFSAAFLSVSFRYYGFPWQKIIADIIANEFFEKIEKFCLIGFKRFKGIRNFRKF